MEPLQTAATAEWQAVALSKQVAATKQHANTSGKLQSSLRLPFVILHIPMPSGYSLIAETITKLTL
jgi:hypothetical protein